MPLPRMLLVEDDETTREVLTMLLAADAWQVFAAESGEAALVELRSMGAGPAVILCDLHLPGLDGAALATQMRRIAPEAALLAMSASEPRDGVSGYDALLRKPFGPAELRAALQGLARPAEEEMRATARKAEDASPAERDLPVLNAEMFGKLEAQMGGRTKDLYAFALADAGDRLRRMHEAAGGTADTFQTEAHALKGSAGMIGAERLARLAAEAESVSEASPALFNSETVRASREKKVDAMHRACDEIRLMLETLFPM